MTEKNLKENLKAAVITLGCKVNQYDTDAMLSVLQKAGFEVCDGLEFADIYIINTCAVTAEAERKSRQTLTKISKLNPDAEIYVCGCASQNNFSQFAKERVEYIQGTEGKLELVRKIVGRYRKGQSDSENKEVFDKIIASDFSLSDKFEDNDGVAAMRTRHFIKVQDGCNNFCSYCIVPYLRGRSRSRSLNSILRELDSIKDAAKETVITGINLSSYGKDINISLKELLIALQGYDMRLRLGSLEVGIIDEEFLKATCGLKKFCPHFHLSLQSGDDTVLKDMNRRYDTAKYAEAAALIRNFYPDAGITTDIIVGFPTETEQAFENTMRFAKEIAFSDIHVFPYSSRKGTAAGKMQVLPSDTVEARRLRLTEVKKELKEKYLLSRLGKPCEVLFESREDGMWCGHTPEYVKVYSGYGKNNSFGEVVPTALYFDGIRV